MYESYAIYLALYSHVLIYLIKIPRVCNTVNSLCVYFSFVTLFNMAFSVLLRCSVRNFTTTKSLVAWKQNNLIDKYVLASVEFFFLLIFGKTLVNKNKHIDTSK